MVKVARSKETGGPSLTWVGRPGITLLSLSEHLQYERASPGRFPRARSGAIACELVPDILILFASESETLNLHHMLKQWAQQTEDFIFLWGNMATPSVRT